MCVCICICIIHTHTHIYIHTYTHTYIYVYIYACMYMYISLQIVATCKWSRHMVNYSHCSSACLGILQRVVFTQVRFYIAKDIKYS